MKCVVWIQKSYLINSIRFLAMLLLGSFVNILLKRHILNSWVIQGCIYLLLCLLRTLIFFIIDIVLIFGFFLFLRKPQKCLHIQSQALLCKLCKILAWLRTQQNNNLYRRQNFILAFIAELLHFITYTHQHTTACVAMLFLSSLQILWDRY